jgi:hypothetical protein
MSYLLRIDREKWTAFVAAVKAEGHTAKWMIESWIDDYLTGPRRVAKRKKKGGKK